MIQSGRTTLNDIFSGSHFFYIPDYQRNYAWGDKQIKDFFDDFKTNYSGKSKRYYYGTILLQQQESIGYRERYYIVDGQQRITTLIVFIKCLLDRIQHIANRPSEYDEEYIQENKKQFLKYRENFILSLQKEDDVFFHTYILGDQAINDVFRTPSQRKLFHLKEKFIELLNKISDDVALSFLDKIRATNVLVYLVDNPSEASLIFETTNDRGKLLTNLEKTKSYLMYKASLLEDGEQILTTIQKRFNEIFQDLEFFEDKQLNEDSILQYTFIAYEKWNNAGKQKEYQHYMETMKKKCEGFFENNKIEDFRKYVEEYTLNIKESFSAIKQIVMSSYEEYQDLVALKVQFVFYPLLIKTYRADSSVDKKNFRNICRLLEIFVFRVYRIQGFTTKRFQTTWYELAKKFNGDFGVLTNSIIDLIKHPKAGNDERFISCLQDRDFYTRYESAIRNYFFWKYENYLRANEQPIAPPMPHEDLRKEAGRKKTGLTIEHIVAQRNTEEQSRVISDERIVSVGHAEKFNREYLNSIGNLTIDPLSANASKGKKDVEDKMINYFNRAPYKCQNELGTFLKNNKWKIESHEERQKKLVAFAREKWCSYDAFYVPNVLSETLSDNTEEDESEGDIEEEVV